MSVSHGHPCFIFPVEMRSPELRPGIQTPYLDQCCKAVYNTPTLPNTRHGALSTYSPLVSVLASPSFMYTHSAWDTMLFSYSNQKEQNVLHLIGDIRMGGEASTMSLLLHYSALCEVV